MKNFNTFYDTRMRPVLERLKTEVQPSAAFKRNAWLSTGIVWILLALSVGTIFNLGQAFFLGAVYGFMVGLVMLIRTDLWIPSQVKQQYVDEVLRPFVAEVLPGFTYTPNVGINPERIAKSGIVPSDLTWSWHRIRGKVDGVGIEFAPFNLDKKSGMLVAIEFHKHFFKWTLVTSEKLWAACSTLGMADGLKIVDTNNPDFNARFSVVGENREATRYVLSETLMEAMLRFDLEANKLFQSDIPLFSFYDSSLIIFLPHEQFDFDLESFHGFPSRAHFARLAKRLTFLANSVYTLGMHTRIWTKV